MLGKRLRRFRVARGMTLTQLADATDHLVSSQTLSKYEKGTLQPSAKTLNRIAAALGIKSAQLWGEPPCDVEPIAFRKLTKLGKREQERIEAFVEEEIEKRVWLQEQIPEQNALKLPMLGTRIKNLDDAEKAALTLRDTLNLGINPIGNLMGVLEDHGIYIVEVDANERFDGISALVQDSENNSITGAVAIRTSVPGDRQRLNLTHELGHLIMDVNENVDTEKAAFRFGAAFLAPAEQLHWDIGQRRNNVQIDELCYLKKKYGMSIQAMLFRLKDLRIITDNYYKIWCVEINALGWKKNEPINIPSEKPERFHQQVRYALSEGFITQKEAKHLINQTDQTPSEKLISERRQFLALPKKERHRILSQQAKEMEDFYENDMEWREWEGGTVVEYEIV